MNEKNHKTWVKEVFDKAAASYGQKGCSYFEHFGKALVSKAHLVSGEHVLDVATGTGAILFPAAEAVGEQGFVIGIDISPEMVSKCSQKNIPAWTQVLVMDAEDLTFPDHYFDVIFCGFAIFFLYDMNRALSEFKRVLKPTGRLAFSIWGKMSPLTHWVIERAKHYNVSTQLKAQSMDTPPVLEKILHNAGFKNIEIFEETETFWHENAEEWWASLWSHSIRSLLEQLSPENLEILHQEALKHVASLNEQERISESMNAIYAICRI